MRRYKGGKYKPSPKGNQYRRRARNLVRLGFATYAEYLASDLWASIRTRVLTRDRYICRRCGGRAWQVHHRRYVMKAMDGTNLGLLISVCGDCHQRAEMRNGKKTSLSMANHLLKKPRKSWHIVKDGAMR